MNNYSIADLKADIAKYEKWMAGEESAYKELRAKRLTHLAKCCTELERRKDLRNAKARCNRFADKIGASIDLESSFAVWVWPPDALTDDDGVMANDPFDDDHYTESMQDEPSGWIEAEQRLRVYADLLPA